MDWILVAKGIVKNPIPLVLLNLEVPVGVEPTHGGFADRSVSHFTTAPRIARSTFLSDLSDKSKRLAVADQPHASSLRTKCGALLNRR